MPRLAQIIVDNIIYYNDEPRHNKWTAPADGGFSALNTDIDTFVTQVSFPHNNETITHFRVYIAAGGTNASTTAAQLNIDINVENPAFSAVSTTIAGAARDLFMGQSMGRYPNDKNIQFGGVVACYKDDTNWNFCFLTCGTTYGTVWGARTNKMYRIDAYYD